jgi:hypothetical protein
VDGLRSDFTAYETEAHEHRRRVYDRFEELTHIAADLERRTAAMEPIVSAVADRWTKIVGGSVVLGALGTVAIGIVTFFADNIRAFIFRIFH